MCACSKQTSNKLKMIIQMASDRWMSCGFAGFSFCFFFFHFCSNLKHTNCTQMSWTFTRSHNNGLCWLPGGCFSKMHDERRSMWHNDDDGSDVLEIARRQFFRWPPPQSIWTVEYIANYFLCERPRARTLQMSHTQPIRSYGQNKKKCAAITAAAAAVTTPLFRHIQ